MKVKILSVTALLLLMALLPFAAAKCCSPDATRAAVSKKVSPSKASSTTSENTGLNEIICGLVAAEYKSDYGAETVKALAIILNTNYKFNPDSFDLNDSDVCIMEEDADNSLKEVYSQIREAVNSVKEKYITMDGKVIYIPYSQISSGKTEESEEYDYLRQTASPWDCYLEEYDESAHCVGVSIEGVNWLCNNGMTAEEALAWYLPDIID